MDLLRKLKNLLARYSKESQNIVDMPPGKYFISHSYKDAAVRDKMLEQLPDGVEPFTFPQISVAPHEFVSNALIDAILACDSVIYLNAGFSAKSFWVAFERDYALRAKKPVYYYDPSDGESFKKHIAPPLDIQVIYTYTRSDEEKFNFIWEYMSTQRFFETPWIDILPGEHWRKAYQANMENSLKQGAFFVSFWSNEPSIYTYEELRLVAHWGYPERNVIALFDDVILGEGFDQHPSHLVVPLWGDENLSHENRIDDLIVRLYWLIYQNQFPELTYD